MKLIQKQGSNYTIEVDQKELELLNNALNEVCNGIEVPEFQTRLGQSREATQALLKRINALLPIG